MQEHKHLNLEHEFVMTMFDLYLATSSSKGSGRSLLEPGYAPPPSNPQKKATWSFTATANQAAWGYYICNVYNYVDIYICICIVYVYIYIHHNGSSVLFLSFLGLTNSCFHELLSYVPHEVTVPSTSSPFSSSKKICTSGVDVSSSPEKGRHAVGGLWSLSDFHQQQSIFFQTVELVERKTNWWNH